jgi:hypothetical protein
MMTKDSFAFVARLAGRSLTEMTNALHEVAWSLEGASITASRCAFHMRQLRDTMDPRRFRRRRRHLFGKTATDPRAARRFRRPR